MAFEGIYTGASKAQDAPQRRLARHDGLYRHPGDVALAEMVAKAQRDCSAFNPDAWWATPARVTGRILARIDVERMIEALDEHRWLAFGCEDPSEDDMEDMVSRWAIATLGDHEAARAWLKAGVFWPDAAMSLRTVGLDQEDVGVDVSLDVVGGRETRSIGYWVAAGEMEPNDAVRIALEGDSHA